MAQANYTPIQLYRSTTASAVPTSGNLTDGELAINTNDGKLYYKDSGGTVQLIASKAGASGDVVGPASATDNAVVRFDGTTGKLVQNSVVTIADSTGDIAGAGSITSTSASGILTRAAATQDGVELIGRAGGSSSYKVTLTPTTLGGNRTLTLPDTTGTVALTGSTVASFSAGSTGFTPNTATTGAVTLAGTLATTNGGTGLTSFTANGVVYASSSSALATGSAVTYNGTTFATSADASISGLTVGKGAGAVSSNTAVGASALAANTTGAGNVAVGYQAGDSITTGYSSVFVGYRAGQAATTAFQNIFIGADAGYNATANYGIGIGFETLYNNAATATGNTAIGYQAGKQNTTGAVTAFGTAALRENTTGYNSAFGNSALQNNTTGTYNDGFGDGALFSNTTGNNNTASGFNALYSNTTSSNNTAVGYQAGYNTTTGLNNVYLGFQAGYTRSTSNYGTFVGGRAGFTSNGEGVTAIGHDAGYQLTTGIGNTLVGRSAGELLTTGSYNTFVGSASAGGSFSGALMTTGSKNTILGAFNGNQGGLDIRTANNYIVLSDGDGNPRVYHDGTFLFTQQMALGSTQNINYGNGLSFGAAGKGLLLQQTVNTNDERVYLTNNAQTSTASGFTGSFAYNKTGANATAYYQVAGQHLWLSADAGTAGGTISWTNILSAKKDTTLALQGASLESGTGITFPASQSASSNANTLDDYEEGSWTPILTDGTNSVSLADAYYTKIGNSVICRFGKYNANISGLSSGVQLQLTGLPFAAAYPGQDIILVGSITNNNPILCEFGNGAVSGNLYQGASGAGIGSLVKGDFNSSTGGSLWGNFVYLTST